MIENDEMKGFVKEKEEGKQYIEINEKEFNALMSEQSQGLSLFYDKKTKKIDSIKLNRYEKFENGEIVFQKEEKIAALKKELSALKVEYSEKEFLFQGKYWQKNREKGDRDNLTGIVVLLMATGQTEYNGWKVIDKDTGEHVYLKLSLNDMKVMALHMQEQVTKALKAESSLIS